MKKKLIMAEYQGRCDENGVAVGHAPKVLEEYAGLLREQLGIKILAPRCVLEATAAIGHKGAKVLPHHIVMKGKNSFWEKIANKMKMFANIRIALRQEDADTVWFFNTEFYLMLYLALFGNGGKRVVCTLFFEGYHGGLLGWIKQRTFERAQKRMDYIISAGESFHFKNVKVIYLPDYYCDEEEYAAFRSTKPRAGAVCLGTMGEGKELEAMTECFSRLGYPLTIAGRFYDRERLEHLKEMAGENILIRDEYLSREEYLQLLGTAAYVVLPYSPAQYGMQTSGVLQEAVFLDAIPVSYKGVLEGNHVPGVKFTDWDRLKREDLDVEGTDFRREYARLRQEVYSRKAMQDKLLQIFG